MSGADFENEVRNIARALWPGVPGSGAAQIIDGRERDCIFEEEHLTHYLEVTALNTLDKVKRDVEKMVQFRETLSRSGRPVKLWVVTYFEPSAHQRTHCRQHRVEILSLMEFRRRIIDASQYLELRQNYAFGSATNPENDSADLSGVQYQPIRIQVESNGRSIDPSGVADLLEAQAQILLLGDYGMGKSFNIREVFLELRKRYFASSGSSPIPVVLNLREHWGQSDPVEALRRHSDRLGFDKPHQLVRAFHAGRLAIVLDGFDEVGSTPWARLPNTKLRMLRRDAVQLIAAFVSQARGKCSILIGGREHFFDSRNELVEAFDLRHGFVALRLSEFTDSESSAYLQSRGYSGTLPDWFPKRPLLLASLAARKLIEVVLGTSADDEPAVAWDTLMNLICQRESQIHRYLDADAIRRILERLATQTRSTLSNLGPITEDDIAEAFRQEVGAYPDERARPLLQRLPGLSVRNHEDGSRSFLDDQLLDVLRANDLVTFVRNPWKDPGASKWRHGIGGLGVQVAVEKIDSGEKGISSIRVATREACARWNAPTLALDLVLAAQYLHDELSAIDMGGITIQDGYCEVLDLENLPVVENVTIASCIIGEMILPHVGVPSLTIEGGFVIHILGASNATELPPWMQDVQVVEFDDAMTNARILDDKNMSIPIRVLLTVLRKLYRQRGSGRRENGLYRGMDTKAQGFVPDILGILAQENLAFSARRKGNIVWHTVSGQQQRAEQLIDSHGRMDDPVVRKINTLS